MTLTDEHKQQLLSEHFLLRHLSREDLAALAKRASVRSFKAEDVIFKRGDKAAHMMVVVSGKVQISSPSHEGDKIIFATMNPGDVFGEIALIDGHERSTDAIADEATEVLELQRDDFIKVLENNPKLTIDLLRVLCMRIRQTNELLEDFSIIDLRRRLAKRLAYLNDASSRNSGALKMTVRVSQEELVAMMGVSQHEAIHKQLQLWEQQGIVQMEPGWVSVTDQTALSAIVAEDF
jgi:CRP/FNR family transcriptional regulator, cyclic AMP receptor protein